MPALLVFFSSRRRHTRYWRDWSSDVCSSDLSAGTRSPRSQRHLVLRQVADLHLLAAAALLQIGDPRRRPRLPGPLAREPPEQRGANGHEQRPLGGPGLADNLLGRAVPPGQDDLGNPPPGPAPVSGPRPGTPQRRPRE